MRNVSDGIKPHRTADREELTDNKCRDRESELSVIAEHIECEAYDEQSSDLEIIGCLFLIVSIENALDNVSLIFNTVHHLALVDRSVVRILKTCRIRSDKDELSCVVRRIYFTVDQHAQVDAVIEITGLCRE